MAPPIEAEAWIWYSFAMLAVTGRFLSRYIHLGSWKRFQLEDYLMILAACLYTILIVLLVIVSEVQTNLIAPEDLPKLDTKNIAERVRGSKMILGLETCMCCVIWLCKSCILLLYYRLTFGLTQHILVKVTGVYVVSSFIVMMILYFGVWCRPFAAYWETPTPNIQCATATHHLITNFTFNLTSDLLILSIPLPLLLRSSLPIPQKLALSLLFSTGLFIIACAIVSKYYSFRQPFSPIWIFWYTREASAAMIITNMTHIWTGLRRLLGLTHFTGDPSFESDEHQNSATLNMSTNPRSDEEQTLPTTPRSSKHLSAAFLDRPARPLSTTSIQSLTAPPTPTKTSFLAPTSPQPRHLRSLSSNSLHSHRSSWLSPSHAKETMNSPSANYSNLDLSHHSPPLTTYPASPRPGSAKSASYPFSNDVQMLRNPAAMSEMQSPRGRRGRVDSITALGWPEHFSAGDTDVDRGEETEAEAEVEAQAQGIEFKIDAPSSLSSPVSPVSDGGVSPMTMAMAQRSGGLRLTTAGGSAFTGPEVHIEPPTPIIGPGRRGSESV